MTPKEFYMNKRHSSLLLKSRRGLTLIEIMVVLALLGVLMTVVAVNVMGAFDSGSAQAAGIQMKSIENTLNMYALKNKGKYPTTSEGLDKVAKLLPNNKVPLDPWGNNYQYFSPATHSDNKFELISYGADGKEGGEEDNADIKSWELE
jgi:general secretion pathway protein G